MLGGGVFVTQNKTLPGTYINFVNTNNGSATLTDRGVVAIALPLNKAADTVIEITRSEFIQDSQTILGKAYDSDDVLPLREIFANATKCVIYDLGTDGTVAEALAGLEAYEFNTICAYTNASSDVTAYVNQVKSWRDDMGKKCQGVVYSAATAPDSEGLINVVSTISDADVDAFALTAWVAGAEAACAVNSSCTNMKYNGELTITTGRTQSQLETCLTSGQFVFHLSYGDIVVLEDINSLTTTTSAKGADFKSNQTIRVIDQIANDTAKLFNTKYLGKIPNNASGRVSLWGDLVAIHRQLETLQAIENFDATLLTVEQGDSKKAVVVNETITVTNAMAQLYMTVVIE